MVPEKKVFENNKTFEIKPAICFSDWRKKKHGSFKVVCPDVRARFIQTKHIGENKCLKSFSCDRGVITSDLTSRQKLGFIVLSYR